MSAPVADLAQMISTMQPVLNPGCYAFACVESLPPEEMSRVIASMRESEGLTVILREEDALRLGLDISFRAAWLTLKVHSDLQAVGLTAAFAGALAAAGIGCNVVAGVYHDHIFVPHACGERALAELRRLQAAQAQEAASP